jgi:hypothetical protein
MTHAVRVHQTGGPDVLRWEVVELAPPAPGELRVRPRNTSRAGRMPCRRARPSSSTPQLRDAERAHRDLEGRKTTGSTVLLP